MSNLMVDLNPSNIKLRDRAVRIVRELTNCSPEKAAEALEKKKWIVKDAVAALRRHKTRRKSCRSILRARYSSNVGNSYFQSRGDW
jgi:N-acetylmuramic acid 6-phosphate (MurNAc-6-P) etherase